MVLLFIFMCLLSSKKKICRNVAVEKKIGISTRVKVGDEEKNCTRIVESKYVQTTKQSHKKIKLTEPSRMVTRHKAASNSDYEFFRLTHEVLIRLGLKYIFKISRIIMLLNVFFNFYRRNARF